MSSITLNDVANELSDMYVVLANEGIRLDAANLLLAGIQADMVMMINQAQKSSVNAISLQGNQLHSLSTTENPQNTNQNVFPIYFKNTTNVYWDGAKNDNVLLELMIIEDDLQKIIAMIKECGCGGKEEDKGFLHYLTEIKDIFEDFKFLKELFKAAGLYGLIKKFWKASETIVEEATEDLESAQAVEAAELAEGVTALGEGAIAVGEAAAVIAGAALEIATGVGVIAAAAVGVYVLYKAMSSDHNKAVSPIPPNPIRRGDTSIIIPNTAIKDSSVIHFAPGYSPDLYAPKGKEGEPYFDNKNNAYHLGTIRNIPNDGIPTYKTNHHTQKHPKEKVIDHSHSKIQFKQDSGYIDTSSTQVKGKSSETVINIKIDGLVKQFTVNTTTVQESAGQIRDMVSHVLLGAVRDSVLVAKA